MSKLTAILIDPYKREARKVEVDNELHVWHKLLRCDCVDVRQILRSSLGTTVDLWFDDNFLLVNERGPRFRLKTDQMTDWLTINGYGLITGSNGHGETISLNAQHLRIPMQQLTQLLGLEFECWEKRLDPDSLIEQLMRIPELEMPGAFRYLDTAEQCGRLSTIS